ncbi:MAG: hypothetical protein M3430_05730 [Acidobacteriota bacterium]|nr:hypothetical protein [Acidobacteriota bacterium]
MRWLILILILSLAGCNANQPSNSVAPVANISVSTQPKTIEAILALPDNFKPAYKIAETRDVSFSTVKRYVVSITLPANLKKEEVEQNLKHTILQTYKDKKPNAVTIWGYQDGDDIKQSFTVGDAVFAPNGKWESAGDGDGSLQNYQTIIKVRDSYLNAKKTLSVGDVVTLTAYKSEISKDKDTNSVRIWNDYGNRYDSNILIKVPNGTKAKILEKKQTGAGDYIETVYKVEVNQKIGWVNFFDIKEYQDNDPKK